MFVNAIEPCGIELILPFYPPVLKSALLIFAHIFQYVVVRTQSRTDTRVPMVRRGPYPCNHSNPHVRPPIRHSADVTTKCECKSEPADKGPGLDNNAIAGGLIYRFTFTALCRDAAGEWAVGTAGFE